MSTLLRSGWQQTTLATAGRRRFPNRFESKGCSDGFSGADRRLRPLTLWSVWQQFRQQAAHLHRLPLRAIGNLVAATRAVGHHDRIGRGAHGG